MRGANSAGTPTTRRAADAIQTKWWLSAPDAAIAIANHAANHKNKLWSASRSGIAGTTAPDSSSILREVAPSCGTCGCARRLRHNGSTRAGRRCGTAGPAPRPQEFPWPRRRGRLRRRRRARRTRIYCPFAADLRLCPEFCSRTFWGGYCAASSAKITGITALSAKVTTTCSGEYESRSARSFFASSKARASDPGRCTVSASVNSSHGARACFGPGNHRIVLPRPALPCAVIGSGHAENHPHSGKTLRDLARAVGGAVVDHDDLERHAGLGGQRFQTGAEAGLFVPGGNDNRDLGD